MSERTDAERMDWIETHCWGLGEETVATSSFDMDGFPIERDLLFVEDARRRYYSEHSIRQAIDAAMSSRVLPPEDQEPAR